MAVIAVNFVLPLSTMFYCYYNVSVTVRRYKAGNCLDSVNIDWSDQMDVTKVRAEPLSAAVSEIVQWLES